jgi:hypothetical protein
VLPFQNGSALGISPVTYGLVIHDSLFEIASARECFDKAAGYSPYRPLLSEPCLFSPELPNSGIQAFEQILSVGKLAFDRRLLPMLTLSSLSLYCGHNNPNGNFTIYPRSAFMT